jgi:hypothetical protein
VLCVVYCANCKLGGYPSHILHASMIHACVKHACDMCHVTCDIVTCMLYVTCNKLHQLRSNMTTVNPAHINTCLHVACTTHRTAHCTLPHCHTTISKDVPVPVCLCPHGHGLITGATNILTYLTYVHMFRDDNETNNAATQTGAINHHTACPLPGCLVLADIWYQP